MMGAVYVVLSPESMYGQMVDREEFSIIVGGRLKRELLCRDILGVLCCFENIVSGGMLMMCHEYRK